MCVRYYHSSHQIGPTICAIHRDDIVTRRQAADDGIRTANVSACGDVLACAEDVEMKLGHDAWYCHRATVHGGS